MINACLSVACCLLGCKKIDPVYQISYGNKTAKTEVVDYFSLSCPQCYTFFKEEFPKIRAKYIQKGDVFWTFHPDPADLLTLQLMVCLEALPDDKKGVFFETVYEEIGAHHGHHGCRFMQMAMEILGHPIPKLGSVEFLQTTKAFQKALCFLQQEDAIKIIPSIEINGKLCPEFPSHKLLEKYLKRETP